MIDQIWKLSREQAQEVLDAFLITQRAAFPSLKVDSIKLDYSPRSIIKAAYYIVAEIKAGSLDEEQRNVWFTRLGYYLGESMIKVKPSLSWGLGDPEYAFANHPVIIGLENGDEVPVITMCKNFILSVVEGISPYERIDEGIEAAFENLLI